MTLPVKTRFAPSPTGQMHFGNIRTALFSAFFAQKMGGVFLLRMENTDQARSTPQLEAQIVKDLEWLGIDWQEGFEKGGQHGPYRQSERTGIYEQYYDALLKADQVYPCFCSEQELAIERHVQLSQGQPPRYSGKCTHLSSEQRDQKIAEGLKPTLRFRVLDEGLIEFHDFIKGAQKIQAREIGDFIIRRNDGTAAFFFCNAIDDALMGVTHVLRGEDHLTNTPRQLLILKALHLREPEYGHLPMILGRDGSKLSKRNGSLSVAEVKKAGFMSLAIQNYLARLGHHYPNALMNQSLSFEALSASFELSAIGHSAAHYDEHQLEFWQKQAVTQSSVAQIRDWVGDFKVGEAAVPTEQIDDFIERLKSNWLFPEDAKTWIKICYGSLPFADHLQQGEAQEWIQKAGPDLFQAGLDAYRFDVAFPDWLAQIKSQVSLKGASLFKPLRLALTGCTDGPEMHHIWALIGAEEIQKRLTFSLNLARS